MIQALENRFRVEECSLNSIFGNFEGHRMILELETARQILEEVFHARPSDVEEMIQMRLEENS